MKNKNDIAIFIQDNGKFDDNTTGISSFPIMNLWSLIDNVLVYTTFEEAEFASKLPTKSKKVFYLWDLEWLNSRNSYEKNKELIHSADFLLCRCEAHADIIEKYFERKPEILKEFDYDELKKYESR